MRAVRVLVAGARGALLLWLSSAAASCGGSDKGPPPVVRHEDAGTRIRRIATRWTEQSVEELLLQNDPNGIASLDVQTDYVLELSERGGARVVIVREERFRTTAGAAFHCTAKGALPAAVRYTWHQGEARAAVEVQGGALVRACREPGFPVLEKRVPAQATVYALRAERLVAIEPAHARAVLVPVP